MKTGTHFSFLISHLFLLLTVGLFACGSGNSTSQQNQAGNLDEFMEDPDGYAYTQLGLACRDGDLDKVKALIEEGANKSRCMANEIYEYDALYVAINSWKPELVKYLIGIGENVNTCYGDYAISALADACRIEDKTIAYDIAKQLLDAGADVNGGNKVNEDFAIFPLFEAVKTGNAKLLRLLIDRGATFYLTDYTKETTIWDMAGKNRELEEILTAWQLRPNSAIDDRWVGSYHWETKSAEANTHSYELAIAKDSCTFMGEGRQYYFIDLCTAKSDNDKLYLFFLEGIDGISYGSHINQDTLATITFKDGGYYITSPVVGHWLEYNVELPVEKK